jgi:hypothetical protein
MIDEFTIKSRTPEAIVVRHVLTATATLST